MIHKMNIGFTYQFEIWRSGKLIDKSKKFKNLIVNEGLDHNLDIVMVAGTQITSWYIIPFLDDYAPLATNNYGSPGFTEATTQVSDTIRQLWTPGAVSGQSVDNLASKATYTFNTAATVYGAALVGGGASASVKGDYLGGGVLFSSANVGTGNEKAMTNGDELKISATITAQYA